jgi:hypothetical protein
MKNMEKIKRLEPIWQSKTYLPMIFIVFFALILCVNLVSAANTKVYDSVSKTAIIKLGTSNVAEVKLLSPQNYHIRSGKNVLVAWYELKNYNSISKSDVFTRLTLENSKTKIADTRTINIKYYNFKTETWDELPATLKAGTYRIGLFTDVVKDETMEWIPTLYNVEISEWATWTADLENGLITWYDFEEPQGTNLTDVIFGTHNGINLNKPTQEVTGKMGRAYSFDGINQWVNITNNVQDFNVTAGTTNLGNMSISVWMKKHGQASVALVDRTNDDEAAWDFQVNAAELPLITLFQADDTPKSATSGSAISLDTWTHIVAVANGTTINIYVNGVLKAKTAYDGTINSIKPAPNIGRAESSAPYPINGSLDEIGIWNRSLSYAEVIDLYNAGVGLSPSTYVTLVTPSNNAAFVSPTHTFNSTIISSNTLTNATLYVWDSNNNLYNTSTITITGTSNNTKINASGFIFATYHWNVLGCSVLECSFAPANYTFTQGFVENSQTYNNITYDTEVATISINVTFVSVSYDSVIGTLVYNGTAYSSTSTGTGNNRIFKKQISIAPLDSEENNTFYWWFQLSNSTTTLTANSTIQPITIRPSNMSKCGNKPQAINYSIFDEKTLANLTANLDATFTWKLNESSEYTKTNSHALSGNDNYQICVNANRTFYTNAELSISLTDYATKNYFFNEQYSNTTKIQNLYLLNDTDAREVIIVVKDAGLTPLENYIIKIYRRNEATGTNILVENDKTDNFGQIVTKLEENDVKYKIEFYNELGTLIKTIDNVIVACRSTICVQEFIIEDTTNPFNYEVGTVDYSYTFSFNNNTNIVTFVWVDNRDPNSVHRLEVIRNNLLNSSNVVCNSTSTLDSGILSCPIGSDKYSYSASAYRKSGGKELRVDLLSFEVGDMSATFGLEGLFWSLILLFTMAIVGIFYPPVGVVLYLAGIFMLGAFDMVYIPPALIIAEVVLGVLFIWSFRG